MAGSRSPPPWPADAKRPCDQKSHGRFSEDVYKRQAQFTPNGFILENVSHIPEDRNKMGLIGNMSVKDNIVLKATDSPEFSSAKGYFLKKKAIRDYALKMQEKYDKMCIRDRCMCTRRASPCRRWLR